MCAGKAGAPHKIEFESPEAEGQEWEFLLFQPSAQHTAALCLQSSEIVPASLPDRETDSSSYSLSSSNRTLSGHAEDSSDRSETSDDLQTCTEASLASSTASCGEGLLAIATQKQRSAESQGSAFFGGWHSGTGSSPDGKVPAEIGSSAMHSLDGQMDTGESYRGMESKELASRLIAWRVVPLVSESLIETEEMHVLGMTAR